MSQTHLVELMLDTLLFIIYKEQEYHILEFS